MSKVKKVIEVESPIVWSGNHTEEMWLHGYDCPCCCGQGGRFGERISADEAQWEVCRVCRGSGKMSAHITIAWVAQPTQAELETEYKLR